MVTWQNAIKEVKEEVSDFESELVQQERTGRHADTPQKCVKGASKKYGDVELQFNNLLSNFRSGLVNNGEREVAIKILLDASMKTLDMSSDCQQEKPIYA